MTTFANLLRDWRKLRRMSQLDLALEAEVSSRHISFLETGRSQPSRDMIHRLGEVLSMPLEIRNLMMTSIGFTPHYPMTRLEEDEMSSIRQALDWILDRHAPYPGIALDRVWTVIRMNEPAKTLFSALNVDEGVSLLELLTSDIVQQQIENWDEVARHTMLRLRSESAAAGGIKELDDAANYLRQWSDGIPATDSPTIPAIYRAGTMRLSLFGTITRFATVADQTLDDLKIELFFPADQQTKEILEYGL